MFLDRLDPLGHRVIQDPRDFLETREKRERVVAMAPGVPRENGARWACLDFLASMEYPAFQAHQVLGDTQVLMAATEQKENQASQEFQVHQVHLEWLACQVHRDLKGNLLMDHQELKE